MGEDEQQQQQQPKSFLMSEMMSQLSVDRKLDEVMIEKGSRLCWQTASFISMRFYGQTGKFKMMKRMVVLKRGRTRLSAG